MAETHNLSKFYIYGVFIAMVISGSLSGLTVKFQSSTVVDGQTFDHPYMNSVIMFLGESFLFLVFLMQRYQNPLNEKKDEQKSLKLGKKLKINWFYVLLPAALDFIDATIQFICFIYIPVSVVKIIGSGKVVITAVYSRFLFKTQISHNQYLGIASTLIGMIFVASSNFLFVDDDISSTFWLIVYIFDQFIGAAVNVSSEWVFSKFHIHQLKMIGGQGLWGLLIMAIFIPIINFIPCNFDDGCVYNKEGKGFVERTDIWAEQIRDSGTILFTIFLQFFIYVCFNYCQITITKFVGAISYAVNILSQTFIVWIVGIIVTKYSDNPNFKWENLKAGTIILQSIGCFFIIIGNLIFNGVIYIIKSSKRKLITEEFQKSYNENTGQDDFEYQKSLLLQE